MIVKEDQIDQVVSTFRVEVPLLDSDPDPILHSDHDRSCDRD